MKQLNFKKYGVYLSFGVDNDGNLLILGISDKGIADIVCEKKFFTAVELHTTGSNPNDHHGAKHTGGNEPDNLKYKSYIETEDSISFILENSELKVVLHYAFYEGIKVVRSYCEITNISEKDVGLEYISSFCMYGFEMDEILIPHNGWCRELDWRKYKSNELGFSRIYRFSSKRISVSNTGTWSTKEHLPMGCIKNSDSTIMWQIENNGSWNWEISDIADKLYLKLSGPSEQENGWWKKLTSGETFKSVPVAVCITAGGFDNAVGEMTAYRRKIAYRSPKDKELPVIFNDYMGCLGADPTTEKEIPVIDAAAKAGSEIYCMDAGWYADGTWWETVGEWKVCDKRFPGGMNKVFDYIRSKGMKAGIWLEPESIGIACPILDRFDDSCFFMRHGKRVIDHGRYQFDFRNKKVTNFLDNVVDGLINDYGIEYFKFDYNIEGGVGTEINSDSFGDGLYRHNQAFLSWVDSIYQRHPNIIIENCSSGGMRMEYASLSHFSLQSLTDAPHLEEISNMAAMSSTAVIPEQSAVWCVPRKAYTSGEIACSMINAIFRRIHISGEITLIDDKQFKLIKEGVDFYKQIRAEIPNMKPFYPLGIINFEDDIKCCGYYAGKKQYIGVVNIGNCKSHIKIPILNQESAKCVYPQNADATLWIKKDILHVDLAARTGVILEIESIVE